MNYLRARQRKGDLRWDFTCQNDGNVWPVGYCAGWREYTDDERARFMMTDAWWAEKQTRRDRYHDHGHESADDAAACYRQYLLDTSLSLTGRFSGMQRPCRVCGAWTHRFAEVDGHSFALCDEHRTRTHVEALYPHFSSITES